MGVSTQSTLPPLEAPTGESDVQHPLAATQLVRFLEENLESLANQISAMVRSTTWDPTSIDGLEAEVLSKTIAEVWRKVDDFDPNRSPRAWFLGFAANILRQQQAKLTTRQRHETRSEYLGISFDSETVESIELFDRLAAQNPRSLEEAVIHQDIVNQALTSLSTDDREIIWLAHIYEMRSPEIAQKLGVTSGAARTRLARAMKRFRVAYFNLGGSEQ